MRESAAMMASIFGRKLKLTRPGLLITGTDTGVGKTVVTCAIVWNLRRGGTGRSRVGVCKPFATGCRRDREGLVSPDAEALAHFADCPQPLDIINPVRFRAPLAPGAAAAQRRSQADDPVDYAALGRSLELLDRTSDCVLVEGVGGILVPLDDADPPTTVLDLAEALDYPLLVVCRPGLGTLNHTAMTTTLLKQRGLRIAGLVINPMPTDPARDEDSSISLNREWLTRLTGVPVVATCPACEAGTIAPERGRLPEDVLEVMGQADWSGLLARPR